MSEIAALFSNVGNITLPEVVMWIIGGVLIYLGIRKKMEPSLLVPMGFGAILVNLPMSAAVTQKVAGVIEEGPLDILFNAGIGNELFLLLLFIGIGAMIDFTPLLESPVLMLFGAAAQFGIFMTLSLATLFGFSLQDAASVGIIGAADGPTSIFVANYFQSKYVGAIIVAAYSYMALVPIIQPPVIRLLTTKKERMIHMDYSPKAVSKKAKILFPILITAVAGIVAPKSAPLIGFLMFGNLIKELGSMTSRLFDTASNAIMNTATIFLGLSVGATMTAEAFLNAQTVGIVVGGFLAFALSIAAGICMVKIFNLFAKKKVNPLVGATGLSAVPMASRVANDIATQYDPKNHVLNYCMASNISGVIGSAVAAGVLISFLQ